MEKFADAILKADRIFVAGAGRSGFVARAFANRSDAYGTYSILCRRTDIHRQSKKATFW